MNVRTPEKKSEADLAPSSPVEHVDDVETSTSSKRKRDDFEEYDEDEHYCRTDEPTWRDA